MHGGRFLLDLNFPFRNKAKAFLNNILVYISAVRRLWLPLAGIPREIVLNFLVILLRVYRVLVLRRVVFIAITGSGGKTTAKEIVDAILSTKLKGKKSRGNRNLAREIILNIPRLRSSDSYYIQEVSVGKVHGRSVLERQLQLVRPQVGVVTNILTDHLSLFGSREAIATEKSKLVACLPSTGTAILNADDPLVMKMAGKCAGRVITYGLMPDAVLRATDVKSVWPERLSFTLHCDGESHLVETNLCGIHWVHSVLAALAVGYSLGIPLDAAVKAIKTVPPFPGRMSPEKLPSGATMIRDDCKAPIMGFPPVLQFMKEARAERKIMIIGTISDYAGSSSSKYLEIAGKARAVCDYVFFVGRWSPRCLAAKKSAQDDSLQAFPRRKDLIRFLKTFLQPNDLVLIKGSLADKLQVVTRELRTVQEESGSYSRTSEGLDLQDRKTKQAVVKAIAAEPFTGESHNPASSQFSYSEDQSPLQFVVGLGNSEEAYQGTRHNIGQRVLDEVASRLEAAWRREGPAMVGYAQIGDQPVCLVKLITSMNQSGPVLRQFGDRWNVQPSQCILVHDEMDLPVGKVKERMRGSAGGHNGVLSILTTYQSVDFRRVKIGIGRPQNKAMAPTFVLSPFSAEEEPVIDAAVSEASSRVLKLLQTATPQESRISMKARRANSTDRPGLLDRKGRRS